MNLMIEASVYYRSNYSAIVNKWVYSF